MASIIFKDLDRASSHTWGETPCALKMTVFPWGTSSRLSTENRSFPTEFLDHVRVVYDFLTDIQRLGIGVESNLDHINSSHHTGTKIRAG